MSDYIIRGMAADKQVRFFAANTKDLVEKARRIHNTSPIATAALGRLMTGTAMMGSMCKNDSDIVTVQIKGDGPMGGLVVTSDAKARVKGYVYNKDVMLPPNAQGKLDVGGAIGNGVLTVIKDLGLKEPYSGQTNLITGEIAEDLTYYFASSEQIPTSVALGVLMNKENTVRQAGGFMIQMMPFASDEVITAMINPEGLDISFYGFIICALISFAVSAVLAFIMADSGVEEAEQVAEQMDTDMNNHVLEENKMISDNKETIICAPVSGKVICREDIPDETFASGIMGEGVGIKPEEEIIVAPFDGEITSVVDTGHAVGLTSSDGVELLIHVGVDTVKMQGDGFQVFVTEGQKVKTGEKLLKFDRDKIRKAGYSDTTAVLVTNSDDYSSVKTVAENVKQKDTVIIIEK